jgi:IMP dehydrogenase
MANGITFSQLFSDICSGTSLGYADLLLMPRYLDFPASEVNISGRLTRNIRLNVPMVSSPMDTVTEAEMAIAMALNGGIGIVHCNNSIDEQVAHIKSVKRYRNGIVTDPIAVNELSTVGSLLTLLQTHHFSCFPVLGADKRLVGMVSKSDVDLIENPDTLVRDVMCPFEQLVFVREGQPLEGIRELIRSKKLKRVPIVSPDGQLVGLVCRKDIRESKVHPLASINPATGKLLVGAAVTTHERDRERVAALVAAGVDVLVLDSAVGASSYQVEALKWIKANYPGVDVICGNVVTVEQGNVLILAGADALKIGLGVGSICTTQGVCGVGRGQASSVYWTSSAAQALGIPVIADGGIGESGDIIKALALGAETIMMGRIMAECSESAGETIIQNGVKLKRYRGMGARANRNSQAVRSRYSQHTLNESIFVAQGVEGRVAHAGSVHEVVPRLAQAVRQGLQDVGARSTDALRILARNGQLRCERLSHGAQLEGKVHHLLSYEK